MQVKSELSRYIRIPCFYGGGLLGQEIGDVVSLSQFNVVSTFFFLLQEKKFFFNFFPPKPRVFLQYPHCPPGAESGTFCPCFLCSQAPQEQFEATVCIFCCVLEKTSLRLEFQTAVPFSCELPLVPVWGKVAGKKAFLVIWLRSRQKRLNSSNTH